MIHLTGVVRIGLLALCLATSLTALVLCVTNASANTNSGDFAIGCHRGMAGVVHRQYIGRLPGSSFLTVISHSWETHAVGGGFEFGIGEEREGPIRYHTHLIQSPLWFVAAIMALPALAFWYRRRRVRHSRNDRGFAVSPSRAS